MIRRIIALMAVLLVAAMLPPPAVANAEALNAEDSIVTALIVEEAIETAAPTVAKFASLSECARYETLKPMMTLADGMEVVVVLMDGVESPSTRSYEVMTGENRQTVAEMGGTSVAFVRSPRDCPKPPKVA